jgi:FkbM family methyltransferase
MAKHIRNQNSEYIRRQMQLKIKELQKNQSIENPNKQEFILYENDFVTQVGMQPSDAEEFILQNKGRFQQLFIKNAFKYRTILKKVPFIKTLIINKKRLMLKNAIENAGGRKLFDISDIIQLDFDNFLIQAYKKLLGRVVDVSGLNAYRKMHYKGASNGAIAHLIIESEEFQKKREVKFSEIYRLEYKKFKKRQRLSRIPIIGSAYRHNEHEYCISLVESMNAKFDTMETIFKNEISSISIENSKLIGEFNKQLMKVELLENKTSQIHEGLNSLKSISLVNNEMKITQNIILEKMIKLTSDVRSELNISTSISEKLDELPNFIAENGQKGKSSMSSVSDNITAVISNDFIIGVPSEEWGLAMTLSCSNHFERGTETLFGEIVKKGMTVIDIGANLGIYSLIALRAGCIVYAYEPSPRTFGILEKNIKVNGYQDNGCAHLFNHAVSENNGITELSIVEGICGHNNIFDKSVENRMEVTVVSIDNHLNDIPIIDVVKIDVEGAELSVLKGLRETISKNHEIVIFLEFAPIHLKRAGVQPIELIEYIEEMGLSYWEINESNGKIQPVELSVLLNRQSANLLLKF